MAKVVKILEIEKNADGERNKFGFIISKHQISSS